MSKEDTAYATAALETIRIAPLHNPKQNVQLAELGKSKEDSELFEGHPEPAPAGAHLKYNNGPLLKNVKVYTIFWGKNWSITPSFTMLIDKINKFYTDILVSPLIDQLGEYSVTGKTIGHGSLLGTKVVAVGAPKSGASIHDSAIRKALEGWIAAGTVPKPTADTLYFVYTDIHIKIIMGGGSSCSAFCGYHDAIGNDVFYAVMPFPSCAGCLGNLSVIDALTGTSSHELCEAITNPIPGTGWYDSVNGEIGDICAWQFKKIGTHNVQKEWSNAANACK